MHFVIEMDAVVAPTTEMAAICVIEPEQKKKKSETEEKERRHR